MYGVTPVDWSASRIRRRTGDTPLQPAPAPLDFTTPDNSPQGTPIPQAPDFGQPQLPGLFDEPTPTPEADSPQPEVDPDVEEFVGHWEDRNSLTGRALKILAAHGGTITKR